MKKAAIILSAITLLGCRQTTKNKSVTSDTVVADTIIFNIGTPFKSIDNTIGFITLETENLDTLNKVEILNDDGSVWLAFYSDFRDDYTVYEDFAPWAFEPSIGVFAIRCVAKTEDDYTIVVNDTKDGYGVVVKKDEQILKHLKKHKNIKFSTIEEHILNGVLIDTDYGINPIRKSPDENAPIVDVELDYIIYAVKMKGDWIQIKDEIADKIVGWIKWRSGNRFMITMFYSI